MRFNRFWSISSDLPARIFWDHRYNTPYFWPMNITPEMRKGGGSKQIYGRDQKAFHIDASRDVHAINATPQAAPKRAEAFKQVISELKSRSATITDNTHNLSSGSGETTRHERRIYVQQQAGTMDQKTFDTMIGKSRLVDQIQVNVSTIQTQVWSILDSVDGTKPAQKSNYGKLGILIIIKVLRVMSVIWILLGLRCLITTIGTRAQQVALVSAQSMAKASDYPFGQSLIRKLFPSLAAPIPAITPPGIMDSMQLVPQAVKNLEISDVTPLIEGALIVIANAMITRLLRP